jgi:hypothetical protein
MRRHIPEKLRLLVAERAQHHCEYCDISEDESFFSFQIDHIISLKHGGATAAENLAWSCYTCNNAKGSDVGTVLLPDNTFVRLFNPRGDIWSEHFEMESGAIYAKTPIGEATIKVLNLNEVERIIERNNLTSNHP